MRYICCFLLICLSSPSFARSAIMALYEKDKPATNTDAERPFSLTGELGLMLSNGNSSGESFSGRVDGEHDSLHWHNQLVTEFLYKQRDVVDNGETSSEVTAQRFFISAQFNRKLENAHNRLFLYADYENDRFKGFDYQASLAAGWSTLAWKDNISELKYSIGPGYGFAQADESSSNDNSNGLILRAAMEYKYDVSQHTLLRQFVSLEAGQVSTKSKSETSLSSRIFGALAMKLSFILNHNDAVSDDVASLDTETRVALVYNFF